MAKTVLQLGSTVETLTPGELRNELAATSQEIFRQFGRGVKYLRFGPLASSLSVGGGGTLTIDGSSVQGLGPREGFVWTVRRITVAGLAAGATPDTALLYRNNPGGIPVWKFDGTDPIQRFGKLEMMLLGGETLSLVATVAGATQVTISGDVLEVAAEEVSKIA
jgi:hypothetical protein